MNDLLGAIWYRGRSRSLVINLVVGAVAAFVAVYIVYSLVSNLFDFDFLFGPYGSPDRSSILSVLEIEASDPRWLGMLKGAGNTISVVVFAIALSSLLGLLIGVARLSSNPIITRLGKFYVETFRNLPLLLIMFFFAFGAFRELPRVGEKAGIENLIYISNRGVAIPWLQGNHDLWWLWLVALVVAVVVAWRVQRVKARREAYTGLSTYANTWGVGIFAAIAIVAYIALLFPVNLSLPEVTQTPAGFDVYNPDRGNHLGLGYISALVSLTLYFSAFIAEIVRGSIQAVPRGQVEASASLGLTTYQRFTLIVLPQALRIMIPSLNNEYQNANKDSTLAHAIAYGEIVLISNRIVNNSGNLLQTYLFIFVVFVLTNLIISFIMNTINKNVQLK